MTISIQGEHLTSCQSYKELSVGAKVPFVDGDEEVERFDVDDKWQLYRDKTFAVKPIDVKKLIEYQGPFVRHLLFAFAEDEIACALVNAISLLINSIARLSVTVVERYYRNEAAGTAETRCPTEMPQNLIKMRNARFWSIVK